MAEHLFSSWEIMPDVVMICTGDVNIDGAFLAVVLLVWMLIRTK